jgi:hypothetical protein
MEKRQAFYTPLSVVKAMIEHSRNWTGCRALEPSSGDGGIVHALIESGCSVDACEIDADMHARCADMGARMIGTDFLKIEPTGDYDLVLMNPPFQKNQAKHHIEHAYKFLNKRGQLVAVVPYDFREKLAECELDLPGCKSATFEELSSDTFKESGANVKTLLLWLEGPGEYGEVEGFSNLSTFNAAMVLANDREMLESCASHEFGDVAILGKLFREIIATGGSCYGVDWPEVLGYARMIIADRAKPVTKKRARNTKSAKVVSAKPL